MPSWINSHAKVNLALHVAGQRSGGYHLIETIAVFADVADRIAIMESDRDGFTVTGPEAGDLPDEAQHDNLVLRARDLVRHVADENGRCAPPVSITLEKYLPAGAGLGGGSSNAAAVIGRLAELWGVQDLLPAIGEKALELGADVPMCLEGRPLIASGVGEILRPVCNMPALPVVLVNPRRHVATRAVFKALEVKANPSIPRDAILCLSSVDDWLEQMSLLTRNDLQVPASRIEPEVPKCLEALERTGARLVRMSGSGATCFGIYPGFEAARAAAAGLSHAYPDWWIVPTMTGASPELRRISVEPH